MVIQTCFWQLPGCTSPKAFSTEGSTIAPQLPAAHVCCPTGSCRQEERQWCPGQVWQSQHTCPTLQGMGTDSPLQLNAPAEPAPA